MSISILNRGASGGMKPELTVIAPSGSTIDLLRNGIIIDTYTLGASETEHTFVVKVGTYTVRWMLGEKVQNKELMIDTVGQYSVEFDGKLWLYREGDECEDVTGGWVAQSWDGDWGYGFQTANALSELVAKYTTFHCVFTITEYTGDGRFNVSLGGTSISLVYGMDATAVPPVGIENSVEVAYTVYGSADRLSVFAGNNLNGSVGKVREKRDDCLYVYRSQMSGQYAIGVAVKSIWLE